MPHPKQGYRLANGDRCPSVTTIIGRFKESGALIQWAYKRGTEHGLGGTRPPTVKDANGVIYNLSDPAFIPAPGRMSAGSAAVVCPVQGQ